MNEIPIEKVTQIIGELFLENRLSLERESMLKNQINELMQRLKVIEEKVDEKA